MVFTHVLMGALVGSLVAFAYPGHVAIAVAAGLCGGGFPDLDMVFVHRRTLHFPALFTAATVVAGPILFVRPTPVTVAAFCFVTAAALHSLTDVLGGGKEMRPWRETDDRAVFNHVTGTWHTPWRVFYDGSVADLVLSTALACVLFLVLPASFWIPIGGILVCAIAYTVLRRWITRQISEDYQTFSGFIKHKLGSVLGK